MKILKQLYEGKAKKVFQTDEKDLYLIQYKDDVTAFNGEKKSAIQDKGIINNRVSNHLMQVLEKNGIPTHFVKEISERETIVQKVSIVPLEVVVRNIVAGFLVKRVGLPEGTRLSRPVIEYCYKNDDLGDPMVNESHILAMGWATQAELFKIAEYALEINRILSAYLKKVGIELIDFKLEFGRTEDGKIILADEISPDTCRLWDSVTKDKLDKDRFRQDLGHVEDAYREILHRLMGEAKKEA